MQRYARDRDDDDEGGRLERGPQSRDTRLSSAQPRDSRREFDSEQRVGQRDRGQDPEWHSGRDDQTDHGVRNAWQPARQAGGRWQYGETDYGVYGPRYTGGYGGPRSGYGPERADDHYGRQGYGQSQWEQERERERQDFDADYLQWRAEQIRKLDEEYLRFRQERYRKFSEEFGAWRKSRASASSATDTPRGDTDTQAPYGVTRDGPEGSEK